MTLDLTDGSLFVKVSGLSDKESFDVWLINDRPDTGGNPKADPGDRMVHVGRLKHIGGTATLNSRLSHEALGGFEINLVAVGRSGKSPRDAGLLFGSPSLFQRFYYGEQRAHFASLTDSSQPRNRDSALPSFLSVPFGVLIPGQPTHDRKVKS
jgi:hypothetical protein